MSPPSHSDLARLLEGAHARIDIRSMQDWLRLASLERRAVEQVAKAARMLAVLDGDLTPQQAIEAETPGAETVNAH